METVKGTESPYNAQTLLKVVEGERREKVQKQFDRLLNGEEPGFIMMISDTGEIPADTKEHESGMVAEGLIFGNKMPPAAILMTLIDHFEFTMSDLAYIYETARVKGVKTEH